jgi:hypothetical protein
MLDIYLTPAGDRCRRFHPVKCRPVEIFYFMAARTDKMVMIRKVMVITGRIIDMGYFFYQTVSFESPDRPVNSIQGNRLQMSAYLIEYVFSRGVIGMLNERLENLGSLMSYAEAFSFTGFYKVFHHLRYIIALGFHVPYNILIVE